MIFGLFSFFLIISILFVSRLIHRKYSFKHQNYINSGTIVMITGGCHGIGIEILKFILTNYKCTVINIDVCKEKFKELEEYFNINKIDGRLFNYHCDISDIDQVNTCIDAILSEHTIDILINNAGIAFNKHFNYLEHKNFVKTIQTNLLAPIVLSKKLLHHNTINQNKLHIVNIASVMSHLTSCKSTDYSTTKWGLYAFHECLRYDYYHNKEFKFTIVCPFAVDTGMFEGFVSPLPLVKILKSSYVAEFIVKSIVLNDKIVFIPFYMEYIALAFKILPTCIRDYLYFKFSKKSLNYFIFYSEFCL